MLTAEETKKFQEDFPKLFRVLTVQHKLNAYDGKHILEHCIGRYVSKEEFVEIMTSLGYPPNNRNKFRLKAICSRDYFL